MQIAIFVKEERRAMPVSKNRLRGLTARAFEATKAAPGAVSLLVCDDALIGSLNERYLGEKGPTDVLSFPQREGPGPSLEGPMLGDIVISLDTALRQAQERGGSLREEFCALYVHGLLHLLGYAHESEMDGGTMAELSDTILTGGAKAE